MIYLFTVIISELRTKSAAESWGGREQGFREVSPVAAAGWGLNKRAAELHWESFQV